MKVMPEGVVVVLPIFGIIGRRPCLVQGENAARLQVLCERRAATEALLEQEAIDREIAHEKALVELEAAVSEAIQFLANGLSREQLGHVARTLHDYAATLEAGKLPGDCR